MAFAMHASWPQARTWQTTLAQCAADLADHVLKAPAVVVIGHVVALRDKLPQERP